MRFWGVRMCTRVGASMIPVALNLSLLANLWMREERVRRREVRELKGWNRKFDIRVCWNCNLSFYPPSLGQSNFDNPICSCTHQLLTVHAEPQSPAAAL